MKISYSEMVEWVNKRIEFNESLIRNTKDVVPEEFDRYGEMLSAIRAALLKLGELGRRAEEAIVNGDTKEMYAITRDLQDFVEGGGR